MEDAPALLRAARGMAVRLGISFHVGSQCTDPARWGQAIALAADVAAQAGVKIGRASGRERVCQYVSVWVVAETLKKKQKKQTPPDLIIKIRTESKITNE